MARVLSAALPEAVFTLAEGDPNVSLALVGRRNPDGRLQGLTHRGRA